MSPIKRLRKFVAEHPELHMFGTQGGFGDLIGRSESYVRALESNGKITDKIAKQIQDRTGVDFRWLLDPGDACSVIPAVTGGGLTHEMVLQKVRKEIDSNLKKARRLEEVSFSPESSTSRYAKLVDGLLAAWRDKLIDELEEGDRANFDDLMTRLGEGK